MNEADNPRSVLLAYLLGELPPGVRERLEERVQRSRLFRSASKKPNTISSTITVPRGSAIPSAAGWKEPFLASA